MSDTFAGGAVTFLNAGPGLGADRMRSRGRDPGWGLGRHTIGSNFFHYNPDPWGSWIEWFSDLPPETFLANLEPPRT